MSAFQAGDDTLNERVIRAKRALAEASLENSLTVSPSELAQTIETLEHRYLRLKQINQRFAHTSVESAELVAHGELEQEQLRQEKDQLSTLNTRLARASATSAELLADLEEKNEALNSANANLARANAHAAELMAQIEERNTRIAQLNRSLARANAHAAELVGELEIRESELLAALDQVKRLEGLIPICMHCHDIRDDKEVWTRLEAYVQEHTDARFSHALCPDCLEQHYPDETAGATDPKSG